MFETKETRRALALGVIAAIVATGCSASKPLAQPELAPMELPTQPKVVKENHFKSDRTGNLTEDELQALLDSPVFLEEETRLGIVPVATAYEPDQDVPLTSVPHTLSAALEATGFFEITTEVSTDWPRDRSIAGLRELAARYRAKYLLLYRHRFVERDRANGWGWTYPTVVGALATPSRTFEASGVMEATLFDVRTGTILFTVYERVEGSRRMNVWNRELKKREFKEAMLEDGSALLADRVTEKVRRLVAANPTSKQNQPAAAQSEQPPADASITTVE